MRSICRYSYYSSLALIVFVTGCASLPQVTLEEAAHQASAKDLATSYHHMQSLIKILPLAERGGSIQTPSMVIGPGNVEDARTELQYKLSVYEAAIKKRGYEQIAGAYQAQATSSCEHAQGGWAVGIQGGALVDLNIAQTGFEVQIMNQFQGEGKSFQIEIPGILVEATLAFSDPMNSDYYYIGEITSEKITVRPDVDAILAGWPGWAWSKPSRADLSNCIVTLTQAQ